MAMVLAMGMVDTGVGVVCESLPMVSPMLILIGYTETILGTREYICTACQEKQ